MAPRLLLALPFLSACAPSSGTGPSVIDLGGHWGYEHAVSGAGTTCTETGSVEFAQSGSHLAGTFAAQGGCVGVNAAHNYSKTGVATGEAVANSVEFTLAANLEACSYQGTIEMGASDTASGSLLCAPSSGSPSRQGSWSMRR